jgi:hypothetical protein
MMIRFWSAFCALVVILLAILIVNAEAEDTIQVSSTLTIEDTLDLLSGDLTLKSLYADSVEKYTKKLQFRTASARRDAYRLMWDAKVELAKAEINFCNFCAGKFGNDDIAAKVMFMKQAWVARQELAVAMNMVNKFTPYESFRPHTRGKLSLD